jgi:hypothetical protein
MEAPLVPAGRGGFPRHPSRLFLSPTGLNFCLALSDESANVIYIRWSVRCSVRCDNIPRRVRFALFVILTMWLAKIWAPFQLRLSPLLNAVTSLAVVLSGVRVQMTPHQ